MRREEVRGRKREQVSILSASWGGNESQLCFLKREPRERMKDGVEGVRENAGGGQSCKLGTVCITLCSGTTKEK